MKQMSRLFHSVSASGRALGDITAPSFQVGELKRRFFLASLGFPCVPAELRYSDPDVSFHGVFPANSEKEIGPCQKWLHLIRGVWSINTCN